MSNFEKDAAIKGDDVIRFIMSKRIYWLEHAKGNNVVGTNNQRES